MYATLSLGTWHSCLEKAENLIASRTVVVPSCKSARSDSVGSSTSEFIVEWPSVDKDVARSDTDMLPLGEDIEARGLAGTKSAHERRKCTGLYMTVNLVEKPTGSTRDGVRAPPK